MTQPAMQPAQPPAATSTPDPENPPPRPPPKNLAEMAEQIAEIAGVDYDDIPMLDKFQDCAGGVWVQTAVCPANPDMTVFMLFRVDDEVHAYCVPRKEKSNDGTPLSLRRYTLPLNAQARPALLSERMLLEVFQAEIARAIIDTFEASAIGTDPGPEPGDPNGEAPPPPANGAPAL